MWWLTFPYKSYCDQFQTEVWTFHSWSQMGWKEESHTRIACSVFLMGCHESNDLILLVLMLPFVFLCSSLLQTEHQFVIFCKLTWWRGGGRGVSFFPHTSYMAPWEVTVLLKKLIAFWQPQRCQKHLWMSTWGRITFWKMVSAFAPYVMCIGAFAVQTQQVQIWCTWFCRGDGVKLLISPQPISPYVVKPKD